MILILVPSPSCSFLAVFVQPTLTWVHPFHPYTRVGPDVKYVSTEKVSIMTTIFNCTLNCLILGGLKKSNTLVWWDVDFFSVKKSKGGQADASCDRWVSVGEEGREWKHLFNNFRSTPSTSKSLRTKVSNKWHCQLHSSCRRNLWLNFSCYSGLVDLYIKITGQSQK